jgi:DNA repair exonuclease SbcCD ATPase subunit
MQLYFKKIRWKNFLSTGNDFTELVLSAPGSTLIVGANGHGKSQLLCAITFALFGKPFRNINKPQLINSITNRDLLVELEFLVGKNSYMIRRGMKPNVFEVYCNDVLLNQDAEMRDYQEHLERKILRTNYKTFCQVVILGSASYIPFMQLPVGQRRLIIEDLLDLQVFTTMNTLLKSQVQENADLLSENTNKQRLLTEKIKLLKTHLNTMRSKSEQFIKEKNNTLFDLETKIQSIIDVRQNLKGEAEEIALNTSNLNSIQTKLDKLKSLRSQMESKSNLLTKEIKFFSEHDSCPTCKQKIDTTFSCDIVTQRTNDMSELENGLGQLSIKYNETQLQLKNLLELDKQYDDLMTQISHETLKIKMYTEQISTIKREITEAEKTYDDLDTSKVSDLEIELNQLALDFNELQDTKQVFATASAMLKDGGIKTKIVTQYIPIINRLINKYLSDFDLFVEFNLDEQFNEVIKSRHRDEFSYASFSEGEKQRINLAILFTWRAVAKLRNSLNTNLLILDEIADGAVDADGLENLQRVLTSFGDDTSIFVISHREALQDRFANTLRFTKHKNFSRLETNQGSYNDN